MKRISILILFLFPLSANAQTANQWGLLTSLCIAQATTGVVESAKYNGHYIVSSDGNTYHAWRFAQDVSWNVAGWFSQSLMRDKEITIKRKLLCFAGCTLLARNAYEWCYKWNRYGNPFDNDSEHNRKAFVYLGIRNGKIVDLYIGTSKITTPLIDIAITAIGVYLFK